MPTVAPVAGTLTFVVICIAIVPDDIGPVTAAPSSTAARDKKADSAAAPTETDEQDPDAEAADKGLRTPRKHASPLPAKVTNRTTDTVRSMFRGAGTPAADPAQEPPIHPPPPPGGPAPVVAIPDTPPLPPVSNVPDPAEVPNPDTALPR